MSIIFFTILLFLIGCKNNEKEDKNATNVTYFTFEISSGLCTLTKCTNKNLEKVIIPATYNGYDVKEIGDMAFMDCTNLKEVIIPDSIKWIGYQAFSGCSSLEKIELSKNTLTINYGCFLNCASLETITIPSTVYSMSKDAFAGCTNLTIYVERARSDTDSWSKDWNPDNRPVIWKNN